MKIEVLKDLWVHLDQVTTLVRKARALEITHFHLSPPEAEILYILSHENRDLTFDEIARWNYRELNSVLIRINKMEKKGLVKKTRRAGTRKTTVRITEKGSSLYGAVASQSVHMIFEVITEEEQKQLESVLTKLESRTRDLLGMGFKPPFLP
jgi:DNA-binding MarR family transcriptional regulator